MGEIVALGYVGITARDLPAWQSFGTEILGLQVARQPDVIERETLFLRYDERAWRILVEAGDDGGLVCLGFEVPDIGALESLKARLEGAGVPVKEAPETAASRRVAGLLKVNDPSGLPLEFFYGAKVERDPFVSPRGVRFVTGELGMGHCVIVAASARESYEFYFDLLGFRLSDMIAIGGRIAGYFAHVNPRHHTLAFTGKDEAPPEFPDMPIGLQHIMVQVDELDAVGQAYDIVQERNVPVIAGLGRHTNDRMVSFYMLSPSGLAIEYGYGARTVDDSTWTTATYDSPSVWGHRPPPGEPSAAHKPT